MIRVEGLTKVYEGQPKSAAPAVADLSFENDTGLFLTLLGPSGCGKSTTLRCIAGLETPDAGQVEIGGRVVFSARKRIDLSPAKRRIGMVFQSYAIWPHMTVLENVAYPLRFRDTSAAERRKRAHEVLEIVGLETMADRPAPRLSGGQQQRVALARALVGEPEVLLLDEPLSNLDTNLRRELGGYVRQLQQDLALTVIYVTHDQGEAMSMSDSIALMDQGRIAERGDPVSMYTRPRTRFAASFLGDANYLEAESVEHTDEATTAATAEGRLTVRTAHPDEQTAAVAQSVMIRPESFVISTEAGVESAAWNTFKCTVLSRRYFGLHWEYRLHTPDGWGLTVKGLGGHPVEPGALVWATAAVDDCILVSDHRTNTSRVVDRGSGGEVRHQIGEEESSWLGGGTTKHEDREYSRTNEEV